MYVLMFSLLKKKYINVYFFIPANNLLITNVYNTAFKSNFHLNSQIYILIAKVNGTR